MSCFINIDQTFSKKVSFIVTFAFDVFAKYVIFSYVFSLFYCDCCMFLCGVCFSYFVCVMFCG
jgi:hypothetical protein